MALWGINYTTAGTNVLTLPYGTKFQALIVWAGGGRGADRSSTGQGGGGGGGACAMATSLLMGAQDGLNWNAKLTTIVGTGGNDSSVNGGTSSIQVEHLYNITGLYSLPVVLARANGGTGVANNISNGGAGGGVSVGTGYSGGNGATGIITGGGGGGGAGTGAVGGAASGQTGGTGGAGSGGRGGNGGAAGAGTSGTQAGGGGGGAGGIQTGGNGAIGAGYVSFDWPENIDFFNMLEGHRGEK